MDICYLRTVLRRCMLELRASISLVVLPLVVRREVMFGGILLLIIFFAANGMSILANRRIGSPGKTLLQSGKGLTSLSRIAFAAVYLTTALSLVLLVWKWKMWCFW